jgi:hypothetical protein
MRKFKITIYELDSKGNERITKVETFSNRIDAEDFISKQKAEPKPYKIPNDKPHYTMEAY